MSDDPGLHGERLTRLERDRLLEHRHARVEHLASMSVEEMTRFLDDERAESAWGDREEESDEERAERRSEEDYQREVELFAVNRRRAVVESWQELRGHQLGPERLEEFMSRPEIEALAKFDTDFVVRAGRWVIEEDNGELLLSRWLSKASELDSKDRARAMEPLWKRLPPSSGRH